MAKICDGFDFVGVILVLLGSFFGAFLSTSAGLVTIGVWTYFWVPSSSIRPNFSQFCYRLNKRLSRVFEHCCIVNRRILWHIICLQFPLLLSLKEIIKRKAYREIFRNFMHEFDSPKFSSNVSKLRLKHSNPT